jgi:uncharacterized protein (UPF0548 family)
LLSAYEKIESSPCIERGEEREIVVVDKNGGIFFSIESFCEDTKWR